MAETLKFFATTAKGMEEILAQEVRELGAVTVEIGRSGVNFSGPLEIGYRACLWSRIANRILLPLKTFSAPNPEKLYGGVKQIRWSDHLTSEQTLAVDFSSSHSEITHTHFGALKVKDAICDQLRSVSGARPSVAIQRPDVRVNVYLLNNEATLSIDLSGESLHLRGYREDATLAPMKENLACAILKLAGWEELLKNHPSSEIAFLDPMCGSGTLPIEAAMMAAKVAPGLRREYFGFLGWQGHVPALWQRLLKEAQAQLITDRKKLPRIVGYDQDFRAIRAAIANLERAQLRGYVHFEKRELNQADAMGASQGLVVVNPPYGERLGEVEALKPLYKELGDSFKQKFKNWNGYIFTATPDLAKSIGLKAARRFVLFNGPLECRLLKFELY